MSKLVIIENTVVRQDAFGRYCLNDLHRAAVAQGKATESQRPSVFLRSEGISTFAQKVSEASQSASVNIIKGGLESGSWAVEIIAIRYAAWIDPAFEVQVYERFRDSIKSNNGVLVEKVQAGLAMILQAGTTYRPFWSTWLDEKATVIAWYAGYIASLRYFCQRSPKTDPLFS
ncbi:KilA-N domain-containing protein [Arsenophonus sp. PmNCSU2021_1]|uniref:KilA-N domain-containing protein n=1 Tax=Arsenophonus sp. PmNCSU2021_1 TaxID=3118989 RepID=UPI002FF3690F